MFVKWWEGYLNDINCFIIRMKNDKIRRMETETLEREKKKIELEKLIGEIRTHCDVVLIYPSALWANGSK